MKIKLMLLTSIILLIFLVSVSYGAAQYFFSGYAFVNGSLAPNGTVVQAFVNNRSTAANSVTVGEGVLANSRAGWYSISFEAKAGDNVTFKLNGLGLIAANGTNTTAQTLVAGGIVTENFNLSINKSNTGSACTYASGCTSGYCVDGYCCNTACTGTCNLCNVAGSLGTCTDSNAQCSGTASSCYCSSGSCAACSSSQTCSSYSCTTTTTTTTTGGGGIVYTSSSTTVKNVQPKTPTVVKVETSKVADLKVEEIKIEVKETVAELKVTVREASKPTLANVAISTDIGATYQYLSITTNIDNAKIEKATVKFRVEKSWATDNNIKKDTIALNRYADGDWNKLTTTLLNEDDTYYYFESETTGFSTFAVTGEKIVSGFWAIVDKINLYYSGGDVSFWDIITLIESYYGG